ncbi:MAG: glutamyl-tRNA reductase [Candidatus Thiodiazotropha sp. (ex Lucinoma aequizonata)]|nr:glutamyl-tRNA reductase [Candidatus Thiodiazotropha sp. (ex Lucinoma aequizonata)]MCU7888484.1 glutamyl-tRNA reductase [Candidatus Thiodiazotropha sp. (ex Lucinoma aequizonata)]MCU7894763.1 glutamyl-tRNA reductase [Candidatus Thiodiazotropha sp. (ex Lucinoma aequizonata)]MCU7897206.1 glutamyl-tRNA reductase [Candidatus Thiodiazotropha sp. (ex Lucinoma aequizonata)]MCU7903429.1 glutamyl-tRNA reductase [Candidatus Thiodiazotropha sp. (ex Lucinoma aequizonata)]
MSILAIGLNHKTASVDIREKVTFGPDIIAGALRSLQENPAVEETVILSTCNRTELYCTINQKDHEPLADWINRFHGLAGDRVNPYLYSHFGMDAIKHLLRVSCGLDSLVLGEPEILGQVKAAYQTASDAGTTGKLLFKLFQHAFSAAKQIRTDTAIGNSPVSVAFAAVSLAKQIFSNLSEQTALLIGAGETIELAARHLNQHGIGRIIVANRTVEKGHALAAQFDGYAIALTELSSHLSEADIVISSTASSLPVLGKGTVESALKERKHRPIFMVDIAVPRDIEPEVSNLSDIYLYTVDDLDEVIQENMRSREEAAEQAEEIINHYVGKYMGWLRSLDAVELIQDYRCYAEQLRDEVLQKALQQLAKGKPADEVIQFMARTLTNKLLHTPSTQMRQAGFNGQMELLEAANTLFQLKKTDNKS